MVKNVSYVAVVLLLGGTMGCGSATPCERAAETITACTGKQVSQSSLSRCQAELSEAQALQIADSACDQLEQRGAKGDGFADLVLCVAVSSAVCMLLF